MKQCNFLAVPSIIIVLISTVHLAKTATGRKLHQHQRRSLNDYDYFDEFREDPEQSSLNGNGGGFRPQRPDATFSNPQQQQPQFQLSNQFDNNGPSFATTATPIPNFGSPTLDSTTNRAPVVFINNNPTVATLPPFRMLPAASANFLTCFGACQTTPEYNPICASNMELYFNEQKFNCARNCGLGEFKPCEMYDCVVSARDTDATFERLRLDENKKKVVYKCWQGMMWNIFRMLCSKRDLH